MKYLVDIDGVLNLFPCYIFYRLGHAIDYKDYPVECGWDIVAAFNKVSGQNWSATKFWTSITRDMWENLIPSGICNLLLNKLEQIADRKSICLLTSPTLDPEAAAGKMVWIREKLPAWLHRQFLIGPAKEFCAHPGAVLIDDSDQNIEKFVAAGGRGILVPRPWNTLHSVPTWKHVSEKLEEINANRVVLLPGEC